MLYRLQFEIPDVPPTNSASGTHWRKRKQIKAQWYHLVKLYTAGHRPDRTLQRARVTVIRRTSVQPDYANLGEGSKHIIDGLTVKNGVGIIQDDGPTYIGRPQLDWEKAPPGKKSVLVIVEELGPEEHLPG